MTLTVDVPVNCGAGRPVKSLQGVPVMVLESLIGFGCAKGLCLLSDRALWLSTQNLQQSSSIFDPVVFVHKTDFKPPRCCFPFCDQGCESVMTTTTEAQAGDLIVQLQTSIDRTKSDSRLNTKTTGYERLNIMKIAQGDLKKATRPRLKILATGY
ncbi:hypothetical protein AC579_10304 [Pseudocercospora musae]|uniref:Uncharacterized protein n=1 Tax=Pseudocercospora musae TaxID=113226 RepID=A0A139I2L1_9PEZI|nr:hypothetical protein AC579_10304 [Pseudocercospora musae]